MTFSGQLLYRFCGGGSFPKVLLVLQVINMVGENCVLLFAFYAQYGSYFLWS